MVRLSFRGEAQVLDAWIAEHCPLWFGGTEWAVEPLPPERSAKTHLRMLAVAPHEVVGVIAAVEPLTLAELAGLLATTAAELPAHRAARHQPASDECRLLALLSHPVSEVEHLIAFLAQHKIGVKVLEARIARAGEGELAMVRPVSTDGNGVASEIEEEVDVLGDPLRVIAAALTAGARRPAAR